MSETDPRPEGIGADAVIAARRGVYCLVSWVILAITLLVLALVGVGVSLIYAPGNLPSYLGMNNYELPIITRCAIVFSDSTVCRLIIGLLGTLLVLKEILAAPKVRFWINVVTLLLLLIGGACYVYALSLPMWTRFYYTGPY